VSPGFAVTAALSGTSYLPARGSRLGADGHRDVSRLVVARRNRWVSVEFDFEPGQRHRRLNYYAASEMSSVLKAIGTFAAISLFGLLVFGVTSKATDTTLDDAITAGRPAAPPAFSLAALTPGTEPTAPVARAFADGRVRLSELRGRPVVVNI